MSDVEFKNVLMTSEDVKIEAGFNPAIEPSRLSENESGSTPIVNANAFPMAGMPDVLKYLIEDLSSVYGSPNEFFAISFLVACGGAVRKRAVLYDGKYYNYAQLWAMIVAPSGVGKSIPIKVAFSMLCALDKALFNDYKAELADWKAKCIACKAAQEVEPTKPFRRQFLIDDATPEALYEALANNSGLTLYSDELSAWFDNFGRYTKNGEVSRYLSIFDNTTFDISRKGGEPLLVSDPYLNIIGGIQPKVLADTLNLNQMRNNGFAQRFLFVYPDSVCKSHYINASPNSELVKGYENLIEYLHCSDFGELTLSVGAKSKFIAFANKLTDSANATANDYLKAMYSKFEIHCLRIALTLELIKSFPNGLIDNSVSDATMSYAIDLCRYFIDSSLKVERLGSDAERKSIDNISVAKFLVEEKGYSQKRAADIVGVTQQYVNKKLKLRVRL
jgi:hypothetical protein